MPDVSQLFLFGMAQDVINFCWQIVDAHLFLIKVPEFLVLGCVVDMLHRVIVAPVVAHPDVMALSREHESQGLVRRVDDPQHSTIPRAMLHQNRSSISRNPVHGKDVPILCGYSVLLELETILSNDLLNRMESVIECRNQ